MRFHFETFLSLQAQLRMFPAEIRTFLRKIRKRTIGFYNAIPYLNSGENSKVEREYKRLLRCPLLSIHYCIHLENYIIFSSNKCNNFQLISSLGMMI